MSAWQALPTCSIHTLEKLVSPLHINGYLVAGQMGSGKISLIAKDDAEDLSWVLAIEADELRRAPRVWVSPTNQRLT